MEEKYAKKENDFKELLKKIETDEKNMLKKKNILQRIEELEKLNDEKDIKIKVLVEKVETLENKAKEILENEPIHVNSPELATCEYCDFSTKNKRRLKLHMMEM